MSKVIFSQFSLDELFNKMKQAFREEIEDALKTNDSRSEDPEDVLLTVPMAAKFLHLAVPTIYTKISRNELPVCKKSGRCYFSKKELLEYVREGRKKTVSETNQEATYYLSRYLSRKKRGQI